MRRIPQDIFQCPVDGKRVITKVPDCDPDTGIIKGFAKAFFTFLKRTFRLFAFSNVCVGGNKPTIWQGGAVIDICCSATGSALSGAFNGLLCTCQMSGDFVIVAALATKILRACLSNHVFKVKTKAKEPFWKVELFFERLVE